MSLKMNYRYILIFLFLFSCKYTPSTKINNEIIFEKSFSNTGFALVFEKDLKKNKIISKSIEDRSLVIFQRNLKKNTSVKVTNLINNKSLIAKVGVNSKYPNFYNSVISKRISETLEIDLNEPYVEIKEINENSMFVANKAKTFEEEKNVADKAPVEGITIKKIGVSKDKKTKKTKKTNFLYIIKVGEFYFLDTAKLLKKRINNDLGIKKVKISEISKTKFRVYLGPFKNLETLKKNFNDISKLKFENIEIVKL
tara:strand:- start:10426 stop:11187 length:762 start_codon:yes stop_codon:yes gene_type:complete